MSHPLTNTRAAADDGDPVARALLARTPTPTDDEDTALASLAKASRRAHRLYAGTLPPGDDR